MVTERARRQYLEAMGIPLWVARHPLPNALDSNLPPVEEAEERPDETINHHQRLHALIDDVERDDAPSGFEASTTPPAEVADPAPTDPTTAARSIRAMLEGESLRETERSSETPAAPVEKARETTEASRAPDAAAGRAPHEPLRFSLQVGALDGRWLLMLARDEAPNEQEQNLINAILQAGGVQPSASLSCQRFGWPMMEGLPVDDALDEARQGFKAFLAGRRARGWHPERLLLFGRHSVLEEVLDIHSGRSRVLDLPFWQGPALESLGEAQARRALWATMGEWPTWWQGQAEASGDDDH
ncbi:hypothetical protein SAMN05421848_0835 [Kushneria avicenniae]|uniref:Uncharacterized protein n=1 Tax=Kushneria avicenniae TaxID=402385 RepID=A0A1I1HTZ8_9GAMM|nr:hypothetical protein [Kushneria avicenniae]SFC27376.1 hypothetical protein SAMN05421848_0835 [Kushneria avicenniae]